MTLNALQLMRLCRSLTQHAIHMLAGSVRSHSEGLFAIPVPAKVDSQFGTRYT